jgi:UDP-N-acetylglucosamine 2-epimerase (non-hydrolysing)
MKLLSVVGARPNFMKIAPLAAAIQNHNNARPDRHIEHLLLHTGQHYDIRLSENFFTALGIPHPDINLEIGSGTHAEQVGRTMMAFEKVLYHIRPDWVVLVGDVMPPYCLFGHREKGKWKLRILKRDCVPVI